MIRSVGFRSYRVPQTRISRWLAPPADRDNFVRQAGRRLTGWGSFSDMLGLAHAGRIHRTKGELFRALSGLERANRGLDRALGSLRRLRANRLRPGRARGGRRCRALAVFCVHTVGCGEPQAVASAPQIVNWDGHAVGVVGTGHWVGTAGHRVWMLGQSV
jgi:hypothetical protein